MIKQSKQIKQEFGENGFVISRQLFDDEEIAGLMRIVETNGVLAEQTYAKLDGSGKATRLAVHNSLADSPFSPIVRSQRIARTMEFLLDDEIYHYHHKFMIKEPAVGGAWEWHQDYGYWYNNGCLYPDMASCLIAVSPASRENGCLQVIAGSHKMGRIDHVTVGDQFQTDPARVAAALDRGELFYCQLQPGDAVFFHANLLHRSDANTSPDLRLSIICCYNTRHNDPILKDGRHPNYSPLEIWSDQRVKDSILDAANQR